MKAACCIGPTCTGNTANYFSGNVDFFQHYDSNHNTVYSFQCGPGKHSKPNGTTIVVSGANTADKKAVCCDDDVAGMCSGNTLLDYPNGIISGTPAGCGGGAGPGSCASFQHRCDAHSQLKSTSASIVLSGATVAERKAVCCDPITPANAAFFDKCSTITTRTTIAGPGETQVYGLAPEITFCGAGKEYDATKAESTCAAGKCNQNTAADITTCCKASTPCVNTDGTSANAAECQVRTHTHLILRHN
jgi:hypothetical protein